MTFNLAETPYESIQGEGMFTGVPSAFVRFTGCNLRCAWCDSMFTSWRPERAPMDGDALYKWLSGLKARHVVVTGGEPMLYPEQVRSIIAMCYSLAKRVTIETNGTIYVHDVQPDLWSVSPKLSSSYPKEERELELHKRGNDLSSLGKFQGRVQYKFVVSGSSDLDEIEALCKVHSIALRDVWLMPEGRTAEEVMARSPAVVELAKGRGYNFSTRLHVLLWGARRGV